MRNASQRAGNASGASSTPASTNYTRRRFLFALSASSAGAAAAAASPALASPAAGMTAAEKSASGYRETEHIRDYYDSARI
jgi:hypothetical protein